MLNKHEDQLNNCNFMKTVLMMLIVLYHSLAFWMRGGWFSEPAQESKMLGMIAEWLNSFHIYAFVLISGYIFAYSKFECKKYKKFGDFIVKKVKRLLVPYAFITIVWLIPWDYAFQTKTSTMKFSDYLLALSPSQLWFLWMLFGIFVVAYFMAEMMWKNPLLGLAISLGLYLLSIVGFKFVPNVFQIWYSCRFMILFFTGMMLRKDRKGLIYRIPWLAWIIFDLILFAITQFVDGQDGGIIVKLMYIGMPLILHIIGAVTAFIVLGMLAGKLNYKKNKLYRFFETNNFTIYLFHQQVVYIVITLLNGKAPSVVLACCNFVTAIAVSSLIAVLLNKWKFTRFLIGQKV